MNKKKLTVQVAKRTGITGTLSAQVIDAVFQAIKESLEKNESTAFRGFGTFAVIQRAERTVLIPTTQKPVTIAAHKVVKFRISDQITLK